MVYILGKLVVYICTFRQTRRPKRFGKLGVRISSLVGSGKMSTGAYFVKNKVGKLAASLNRVR